MRVGSANASIPIDVKWSCAAPSWARVGAAIGGAGGRLDQLRQRPHGGEHVERRGDGCFRRGARVLMTSELGGTQRRS